MQKSVLNFFGARFAGNLSEFHQDCEENSSLLLTCLDLTSTYMCIFLGTVYFRVSTQFTTMFFLTEYFGTVWILSLNTLHKDVFLIEFLDILCRIPRTR
jgi:hypothetical protein